MRRLAHILFPTLLVLSLLGMSGCNDKKGEATNTGEWQENFLAGLDDAGKAGQVLCYTVDPIRYFNDAVYKDKVRGMIKICRPGAVYLSSDLSRYEEQVLSEFDPVKLRGIVTEIQNYIGSPSLFAASVESGVWYWGAKATQFPSPIALGATGSASFAYRQGKITAVESVAQGINWLLAPVVNHAASSRDDKDSFLCFGADPARIGEFGAQFVKGVQEADAAACLKFYPGPEAEAEHSPGAEPLKAGIAAGALSIMGNPFSISGETSPEDASSANCRDILSTEFGFKGVVLREVYGVEDSTISWTAKAENVLKSFVRGQDMIILSDDPDNALPLLAQLVDLVRLKRADMNSILPSVKKVVLLKDKLNLHEQTKTQVLFTSGVGIPEYTRTAEDIARASITLLKNEGGLIPLNLSKRILFANFIDSTYSAPGIKFSDNLLGEHPEIYQINVLRASDSRIAMELLRRVADADVVVCTFFIDPARNGGTIRFSASQLDLLHRIGRAGKPCVGISFSSPFLVNDIPEFKAFLTTYSLYPFAPVAVSDVLFGKAGVSGKLPITVSTRYPLGSGLTIEPGARTTQIAGAAIPGAPDTGTASR